MLNAIYKVGFTKQNETKALSAACNITSEEALGLLNIKVTVIVMYIMLLKRNGTTENWCHDQFGSTN